MNISVFANIIINIFFNYTPTNCDELRKTTYHVFKKNDVLIQQDSEPSATEFFLITL